MALIEGKLDFVECGRCHHLTITTLVEGFPTMVDATALDIDDQAAAVLAGRKLYARRMSWLIPWAYDPVSFAWPWRFRPREHSGIHATHACRLPGLTPMPRPVRTPRPEDDIPPF